MNKPKIPKPWSTVIMHVSLVGGIALVFYLLSQILPTVCPIKLITDIPCPFCGMTRAHLEALSGNWKAAFTIHPLFPLGVPYLLLIIHEDVFPKKYKRAVDIAIFICTALIIALYITRLITEGLHFI